ncbi:hypothetical protein [Hyphomicrobium sp.]|uniref:hypothetical protein n=1 Tax=Hyphomicrobium sp. TaxID=82 RepID=UPI002E303A5F|nr:hypothetical protein [Hyphomicrobium sp.]HEX2841706.1 hypothetical protein [Hyphomicrobium sp.]
MQFIGVNPMKGWGQQFARVVDCGAFGGNSSYKTATSHRSWLFLAGVVAVSGTIAGLQLLASFTLLLINDVSIRSQGLAVFGAVFALTGALYLLIALLDYGRARVLSRTGLEFVRELERRVLARPCSSGRESLERLADLECITRFLAHAGPSALFDVLWLPFWFLAAALVHPALGCFAMVGALLLLSLTVGGEAWTPRASRGIARTQRKRLALAAGPLRSFEACNDPCRGWFRLSQFHYRLILHAAERAHACRSVTRGARLMLQTAGMGLATLLAIDGCLSAGGVFAASLIVGRMFASLDAALVHRRSFVAARKSYLRLRPLCAPWGELDLELVNAREGRAQRI